MSGNEIQQLSLFEQLLPKEVHVYCANNPNIVRYMYWVLDESNQRFPGEIEVRYLQFRGHALPNLDEAREIHREDEPALYVYGSQGELEQERYCVHGKLHREDGPAEIIYADGRLASEAYWVHGVEHREDGPAFRRVFSDGKIVECYMRNGRFYRQKGPARVEYAPDGSILNKFYSQGPVKNILFNVARNAKLMRAPEHIRMMKKMRKYRF